MEGGIAQQSADFSPKKGGCRAPAGVLGIIMKKFSGIWFINCYHVPIMADFRPFMSPFQLSEFIKSYPVFGYNLGTERSIKCKLPVDRQVAGVGVAEKVCAFLMLLPSAYMQSMSSFVAQNYGARKMERARKALWYGIISSLAAGIVIGGITFFRGDFLAGIFAKDMTIITAASEYLKAYAVDCVLTAFLFCFIGFFNGCGRTAFVMLQGTAGAFLVRIPVSYFMSRQIPVSLFHIGLATPCSTIVQIVLCLWYYSVFIKKPVI